MEELLKEKAEKNEQTDIETLFHVLSIPETAHACDRGRYFSDNGRMNVDTFVNAAKDSPRTARMPALFVGHGSPMNAIEDNEYVRAWKALGPTLPRPRAILMISAHWYTDGLGVHVGSRPRTIHDFWGFPEALSALKYPAPGSPDAAKEAVGALRPREVAEDNDWGLDHGAWVPLLHLFPKADVPVFQLSIDATKPPEYHLEIGRALGALRERGILLMGSGNIVHNLGKISWENGAPPKKWAEEFDAFVARSIERGEERALIPYHNLGEAAAFSIPTPDHYLPLLSVLGARAKDDRASFPVTGIVHGSVSMRAVLLS